MSNPSTNIKNAFCSSSYSFIPNKKHDVHKLNFPFIICLSPFNEKKENQVKYYKYSYFYVPKCCKCRATSFPKVINNKQYNKKSFWICPICQQENIFKSSYLKIHSYFEPDCQVIDFYNPLLRQKPKLVDAQPNFLYQNKSFLFILELTTSTQSHHFFHEALTCIKKQMENKDEGYISVFIVNSHLHFPMIQKSDVTLTTTYEIIENEFPPFKKIFFDLSTQNKLFFEFIEFIELSVTNQSLEQSESTEISLFEILQSIINLIENKNIKCVFLVSQIVKDNENHLIYKSYKDLTFSIVNSILPFDFFLIENMFSNNNFDILRETVFIDNDFINFYVNSSIQIPFFINDFCNRINCLHYRKVGISAIIPPSVKVSDIHGCGVRTSDNDFSLKTMNLNDSVYYFISFSRSEICHGETLSFQFHVNYFDSNNEPRIRIINHQVIAYDDLEMAKNKVDFNVIIAGCINHAIDAAREEEKVQVAVDTMKNFKQIFDLEKNDKFFAQHQNQLFQINWFKNVLNVSLNYLYVPLFWSFILGKFPCDIQLLLSPLIYKISINDLSLLGPFLIIDNNFDEGIYYIIFPKNRGVLFAFSKVESSKISSLVKDNLELIEKMQKMFPEVIISVIESPIHTINDLKSNFLFLH